MKRTRLLDSLRNRFPAVPRLAPVAAGAPVHFAASGGGGGNFDDPDDDYFDEDLPEEPAPQRRRNNDERRATAARRRTVQTDPDDRYWTDYLRIALPVIGLLLVIAVFWYWAQQLIDDNGGETPATEPPGVTELIDTTPEATEPPATPPQQEQPAQESTVENPLQQAFPTPTPTEATAGDTTDDTADGDGTGTDNQAQEDPVEEQPAAGDIAPDAVVVVTEDVNLRSEPTATEDNVVTVLSAGSELTVLLGPEESEDYVWWNVVDNESGNEGWVVEDFIEPAG